MSNPQFITQSQEVNKTNSAGIVDVYRFVVDNESVSIPILQKEFGLTYLTAKKYINKFESIGLLRYNGDIEYTVITSNIAENDDKDDEHAKHLTKEYIELISETLYGSIQAKEFGVLSIQDFDGNEDFVFEFRKNKNGYYLVNINSKPMRKRLRTAKYARYIEQFANVKLYGNRIWVEFSTLNQLIPAILKLHSIIQVVQSDML